MFNAIVYKVTVQSLSGIMDEAYSAKESVRQWNMANAERSGKVFLIVDDLKSADILVGVIDNWIENKELIDESLNAGKRVLLFFDAYADPNNTIPGERTEVATFFSQTQQRCFCTMFNDAIGLCNLLKQQLNELL